MKTDIQLQRDVLDELRWQPSTQRAEIGVAARDGVVTLSGYVDSYAQKFEAERAAELVSGVHAIADELDVRLPDSATRSDTDIAHSALLALEWNVQVPDNAITLKVENGWITLQGQVDWQYQKAAAEGAVRYLMGVKGVYNALLVRQLKVSASLVKERITDALKRSALVDSGRVTVESLDGKVILRGTVRSWSERRDAERAAWAAPGVSAVEDRLTVAV
jgi:osmotically-inducible protein OsmY